MLSKRRLKKALHGMRLPRGLVEKSSRSKEDASRLNSYIRWQAEARTYDKERRYRRHPKKIRDIHDSVRDRINIPRDGFLVDLACGTGQASEILLRPNTRGKIVGLDWADRMLKVARKKKRIDADKLVVGDLTALPFQDNSVDFAVSIDGYLGDSVDYGLAASELKRVLKKGSQALIALPPTSTLFDVEDIKRNLDILSPVSNFREKGFKFLKLGVVNTRGGEELVMLLQRQ